MPKAIVRFVLLMLIMFNHAVSACDNIVMHLPDEDHPFVLLDNSKHSDFPAHQHHADAQMQDDADPSEDHHPTHAHVACYITELYAVAACPAVHKANVLAQYALITTTYTPPVPPPDHA